MSQDHIMNNADRVIIVTGAGSGIGLATVELLHREGAKVVAVDLTADSLVWTTNLENVVAVAGSVTDQATSDEMVAAAISNFGRLDGAALNAGISIMGDIERGSIEDYDRLMDVNVRGVALGMKACLSEMGEGASIVVTGSVSGLFGDSGFWAYNASKGASVNMARAASLDVAHRGIRINAVCPGPTKSGITAPTEGLPIADSMAARVPLGRFGEAAEVGAAISFLLSPAASFISGVALPVDGGVTAGTGQWATYGARRAGFA